MSGKHKTVTYTAAGGIVIDESGDQVLLLIRPSRDEVRLPKGHLELNECMAEAALRETQEETGYGDLKIIADLGEQLITFFFDGNRVKRTEHYFLMQTRTRRRVERPHEDERQFFTIWVPWDAVEENLTFEAEQEWARRAQEAWEHIK
jgi:ADP-ribose pyrophosphatase YjhB (NUDIX family)